MDAKQFLIHKGISNKDFMDSGVADLIETLLTEYQSLQLQQTGVMACFSEEQLSQINKYGKHQHNRASMDLSYISFEFWLK